MCELTSPSRPGAGAGCAPLAGDPASPSLSLPVLSMKEAEQGWQRRLGIWWKIPPHSWAPLTLQPPLGMVVTHISTFKAGPGPRSFHDHQDWPHGIEIRDMSCDIRQLRVQILLLLLAGCVILNKSLSLSESHSEAIAVNSDTFLIEKVPFLWLAALKK